MNKLVTDLKMKVSADFGKGETCQRQDNFDVMLIGAAILTLLLTLFGFYVIAMIPALLTFGLALMDEFRPSKTINIVLSVGLAFAVFTQCDNWVLFLAFAQTFVNFGMRVGRIDKDEVVILQGMMSVVGFAAVLIMYAAPGLEALQMVAQLLLFCAGIAGVYMALMMGNVIQGSTISLIVGLVNIMGLQAGFPLLVGVLNVGLFLFTVGSVSRQLKFVDLKSISKAK